MRVVRAFRTPLPWTLLFAVGALVAVAAGAPYEARAYLAFSAIILAAGTILVPRAARKDGETSEGFLTLALLVHVLVPLVYYAVYQVLYEAHGDFVYYRARGVEVADSIRAGNPTAFFPGGLDFPVAEYLAGILYLISRPNVLGPALVSSALAFTGSWFFYRAFRESFPRGNGRLYSWLVFFVPSIVFWPAALGKEGVMLLSLGAATYGFGLLLRGNIGRGAVWAAAGSFGALVTRPPIAAAVCAAALAASLISKVPRRAFVVPIAGLLVAVTAWVTVAWASGSDKPGDTFSQQLEGVVGIGGTSRFQRTNFIPPDPRTPLGLPAAIVTTTLRPFPWEIASLQELAAVAETVFVVTLFAVRRREIWLAIKEWRRNPMVVMAVLAFLGVAFVLSPIGNFGALVRLRIQLLPFLLMLPAMVRPPAGGRGGI